MGNRTFIHFHWTDVYLLGNYKLISIVKSLRFALELCLIKILGIKLVWTVHNLFNHEQKDSFVEKYCHRILCTRFYDQITSLCRLWQKSNYGVISAS